MQGDGFLLLWVLFVGKMGGQGQKNSCIQVCKYVSM